MFIIICSSYSLNHISWPEESSHINSSLSSTSSLISLPESIPNFELKYQSRVNLDTRIEMILSGTSNVNPDFLSIVNNSNVPDIIHNNFDLTFYSPSDNQSNLTNSEIFSNEELPPLSPPPSPFLSEEIYLKCFETAAAAELLKINKENEKLETESALSGKIRRSK